MCPVRRFLPRPAWIACTLLFLSSALFPAQAAEYAALEGVKGLNTVFDFSLGSPRTANLVFPAIMDVYRNQSLRALPDPPQTVIVFRGPAVKLLITTRKGFAQVDQEALDKVAETLRQMKKDGVRLEVCMYAVKVQGIDPANLLPEIDRVANGFISLSGYQAQGYSTIPIQ